MISAPLGLSPEEKTLVEEVVTCGRLLLITVTSIVELPTEPLPPSGHGFSFP